MTVTWSTNETIVNWTSSDDPAVTFQVVKIAGGTGGGGGGVTDHGDLTGLADDDHLQYQYVNATYTEADPFTITDESAVVTQGAAITLPSAEAWANRSVMIVAAAVDLTVTCHAGDQIAVTGGFSSTLSIPSQNIYQLTSTNFGGTWAWLQTSRFGPAFDMPYWYGQSITQGHVIKMGASAPEWGAVTPGAHASTHQDGGSDELALDASQTTSGTFNTARLGSGTASAYTFLNGAGAWTDDVPVLVPCKNTSGGSIAKGAPVYVTGTVGSTYVVEVAPADADVAAKMPAIGLLESALANNATGYVVAVGVLTGVDTSSYAVNDTLYVSTTAGQLTATQPTGTSELIQNIARVTRVHASTGSVVVLGAGRTNGVPNSIDAGKLTSGTVAYARLPVGSTASTVAAGDDARLSDARAPQWRRLTFSNADYNLSSTPSPAVAGSVALIQTGTLSAARTVTLPAASAVPAGGEVIVNAGAGASATNTVTVQRAGSDTINGGTASAVIGTAWGQRRFVSDGTSAWAFDDGLMRRSSNLSDLADFGTSRSSLGVVSNGGGFLYTGNASGLLVENVNPTVTNVGTALTLTSGRIVLVPIYLPGGLTITNLSFCSQSTAASSPTNQWYCLTDSARVFLRATVNDTTTAWASQTVKTLALSSTYTVPSSGYYYVGICVTATTPPTIRSTTGTANGLLTDVRNSDTGLTTPPTSTTFGAGAMLSSYPWVGVS